MGFSMTHESDGHIVKKKIAMDVQCRGNYGHKYRIILQEGAKGCPACGEREYDIEKEIYEGDEDGKSKT